MAEKIFKPVGQRLDLNELELTALQVSVLEKLAPLDKMLHEPERQINRSGDFSFSSKNVAQEIARISGPEKNHLNLKNEKRYKGLYLWVEKKSNTPVYVGISQHIEKRISDHATASSKSMATWAYLMAKAESERFLIAHAALRNEYPDSKKYDFGLREEFQKYIQKECYCLVLLERNDYLLYLMEVYAAIKYKTYWNLFHTH
jgi:predicted GIY-YIG superfamily endonuclease